MNIKQAKRLSIVDYLDKANIRPDKVKGNAYWYKSPLRDETCPSFKVSVRENLWYDYAIAEGGDLIELVKRMEHLSSTSDALRAIATKKIVSIGETMSEAMQDVENTMGKMRDVRVLPLRSNALLSYFRTRSVDVDIGRMYCREIHYKIQQKHYYGIAFGNLSQGYEVRNPYFKGCIGHKDITLLAHTFSEWQDGCLIFEGFMDFLSYMTLAKRQDVRFAIDEKCDYIILNSVANLRRACRYLERYAHIHCLLDNDTAGQNTLKVISSLYEYRVTDESFRYAGYKDINDYLMGRMK